MVIEKGTLARNAQAKPHLCIICDETNPEQFFKKTKSKCKKCIERKSSYIKKGPRPHLCIICDESSPELFRANTKSKCIKCSNLESKLKYISVKKKV